MAETLSATELALLRVFRQKGLHAGAAVPTSILTDNVVMGGGAPVLSGEIETALLGLQVRGLIVPDPDPFSATSWKLTMWGDEVLNSPAENRQT